MSPVNGVKSHKVVIDTGEIMCNMTIPSCGRVALWAPVFDHSCMKQGEYGCQVHREMFQALYDPHGHSHCGVCREVEHLLRWDPVSKGK